MKVYNQASLVGGYHWRILTIICISLPVLLYTATTLIMSRNLPIFDDYIIQLEIARLQAASDWLDKVTILFSQLNEHRLAYTRLWFWLSVELTGSISYVGLITVGNVSLFGVGLVYLFMGRRLSVPALTWAPLTWLLFQFQYYPNSMWAMASLQNLTIHLLYLLLFVLIIRQEVRWLIVAGVTAVITCYTSGNGFVAPVLCLAVLLYQGRYKAFTAWVVLLVVIMATYFGSYQPVENLPVNYLISLRRLVFGTFIFLGLVGKFGSTSPILLALYGLLLSALAFFASLWSVQYLRKHDQARQLSQPGHALLVICLLIYGFIAISAVAVVRGRWALGGLEAISNPRYSLYSTMWLVTLYIHIVTVIRLQAWRLKPLVWTAIGASVLFWGATFYHNLSAMYEFRSRALSDYYNWTQLQPVSQQQLVSTVYTPSGSDRADLALINATLKTPANRRQLSQGKDTPYKPVVQKTGWQSHLQTLYIANYPPPGSLTDWRYVVLEAPGHTLMVPAYFPNAFNKRGFRAEVQSFFMRPQAYQVGVLNKDGMVIQLRFSDQYVMPEGIKSGKLLTKN